MCTLMLWLLSCPGSCVCVWFFSSSSSSFQIPYVGSKFMYVAGIFICGGCTFIFGYVLLVLLHVDSIG